MMSTIAVIAAGLALGAAGSGHCGVMCGPLVLVAHPRDQSPRGITAHVASYHAGRLACYAAMGAVIGLSGGLIAASGWGRALAIVAAAALLLQAIWQWRLRSRRHWPALTRAIGVAGFWMRRHPAIGPAAFGALTGLLPCGLVYAALTTAGGLGTAAGGATFMLAFGAGSVPVLAAIGISAERLRSGAASGWLRRAAPVGLAIAALLLVFRASGAHAAHGAVAAAGVETRASAAHHHPR